MPETEKVLSENEQVIEDSADHYVKVTTIKKKKIITSPVETQPEDFLAPGIAVELNITPEEKKEFLEVLKEEGLTKTEKVEKEIEFEEEKTHVLTNDEIVDHLMGKLYKE